jgi:hypothetical protein
MEAQIFLNAQTLAESKRVEIQQQMSDAAWEIQHGELLLQPGRSGGREWIPAGFSAQGLPRGKGCPAVFA